MQHTEVSISEVMKKKSGERVCFAFVGESFGVALHHALNQESHEPTPFHLSRDQAKSQPCPS